VNNCKQNPVDNGPTVLTADGRGGVGPARKGRSYGTPSDIFYFLFFDF
jgi:hypothetical protein